MSFDGDSLFGVGALPLDTWFDEEGLGTPLTFPHTLAWSGFWRSNYAGAPWVGETTAGASGGRSLDDAADPPAGTAQNGWTPAGFNGGSLLVASGLIDDYIGVGTAFEFAFVAKLTQPGIGSYPDATPVYDCPQIFGDLGGNIGLAVSNGGLRLWMYDSVGTSVSTTVLSPGAWANYHVIQGGWDGANLWLSVDGGTAVTAAIASQNTLFSLRIGVNYDNTDYLVADVEEAGFFLAVQSAPDRASYRSYAITRYALGGVQTVTTAGFRGRGLYGASAATLSALLSSLGSKGRQISGASVASVGAVTSPAQGARPANIYGPSTPATSLVSSSLGARPRAVLGASAASIGALTVSSFGSRQPLVAGASAIALSAMSLTSMGSRAVGRSGASALTLTIAAAAQGLVGRGVSGASSATVGPVLSSQLGATPRAVFGPSLVSSVITAPAQGLVGRAQVGSSVASVGAVTVPSRGSVGRLVAGASALSSIVQASSFGLVSRGQGGASAASVGALTVVTAGSRPKDVLGASTPALGGIFVTSYGSRSRDVFGASVASTGTVTQNVFTVGFRGRDAFGASSVSVTPIATQAQGLVPKIAAGASTLSAAIAAQSKGARFPDRGGASVLSSSITVPAAGRQDRNRGGSSTAMIGAVVSQAAPAPGIRVAGASNISLSPIVLASLGSRARQVSGVAAPVSLITVPTLGARSAERRGASTLSLSASTVSTFGLVGRTQVGAAPGSLSAFNIGTFGFRARARNGACFVTVGSPYSDGELRSRISAVTQIASVLAARTSFVHATGVRTTFSTEVEMELYVGADAKIETEVRVNGVLTDPTSLSCEVTAPDGSLRTYVYPTDITKVSTGVYRFFVDCTMAGTYKARWVSPGPGAKGADRLYFDVTA